jgi:ribbon-helix-helix CopG family protein
MAITSVMAKMTVRSTFALDPETVDSLDRLARLWEVSKSEALRRIVNTASVVEEIDAASDALAALDEVQQLLGLDEDKAEVWIRRIREERVAGRP